MERTHEHSGTVDLQVRGNGVPRRAVLQGLGSGGLAALVAVSGRAGVAGQEATPEASPRASAPIEPQMEWLGTLTVQVGEPITVGATPYGTRLIAPITGGSFQGPKLTGTVLPMGGEWMSVRPDDVGGVDVRITVETQDGALIYITYRGYLTNVLELLPRLLQGEEIPREAYYLVVTHNFETSASQYDWLQRTVTVGIGSLVRGGVSYEVFAVS